MRKTLWCIAAVLLLSGDSCAYWSVFPIAEPGQRMRDTSIVGTWTGEDSHDTISITLQADSQYAAMYWSRSRPVEDMRLVMTRIGSRTFIEAYPADKDDHDFNSYLPLHQFVRLDQTSPSLVYRGLSGAWLKTYLKSHPRAVGTVELTHEYVLTDSTPALRAFLLAHGSDAAAWEKDSAVLHRIGPPRAPR